MEVINGYKQIIHTLITELAVDLSHLFNFLLYIFLVSSIFLPLMLFGGWLLEPTPRSTGYKGVSIHSGGDIRSHEPGGVRQQRHFFVLEENTLQRMRSGKESA